LQNLKAEFGEASGGLDPVAAQIKRSVAAVQGAQMLLDICCQPRKSSCRHS